MRVLLRLLTVTLVAWAVTPGLQAQTSSTLYVVRYVEAAPASQDQVATLLKQFADASKAQNPVRFEVAQGTLHPNQFVMLEVWIDQQALDGHVASASSRQFRDRLAPLLLAPVDERVCVETVVAAPKTGRAGLYVVTHVDVPPPSREATLPVLHTMSERSRGEAGNLRFDVVHQKDRTNHFTVIEAWSDQTADDNHQLAAHTKAFRTSVGPMLGALYDQRWYRPL